MGIGRPHLMEISASFDAATLNLAANVANVRRRASGRVGGGVLAWKQHRCRCVNWEIQGFSLPLFCGSFRTLGESDSRMCCLNGDFGEFPRVALPVTHVWFACVCVFLFPMLPSVRELQQDTRELNQADLPEVDPEENSAEFMGILIKVTCVQGGYKVHKCSWI